MLTVKTDKGDFVLDNQEEEVLLWSETGYRFVKRQSQSNPNVWVALGDPRPTVATAHIVALTQGATRPGHVPTPPRPQTGFARGRRPPTPAAPFSHASDSHVPVADDKSPQKIVMIGGGWGLEVQAQGDQHATAIGCDEVALPQIRRWPDCKPMSIRAALSARSLELVKIRASQINGCAYCLVMHTNEAREHGETDERMYLLDAWREAPVFSERERAALGWVEAVTLVAESHVPDDV